MCLPLKFNAPVTSTNKYREPLTMSEPISTSKLPILAVDFSKNVDHNIFYPLTDASMANALGGPAVGWSAESVRTVNAQHSVLSSLPRKCMGYESCAVSGDCPFTPQIVTSEFMGSNCPVEVVEAFKLFAGYVIDLDIKPEDFTDLQLVMDLIRLTLLAKRCDSYNKTTDILVDETIMVIQKTGQEVKKKVATPTFVIMREIREDIQNIYTMLVASREGKVKRDSLLKESKGASDMFAQLNKVAVAAGILTTGKPKRKKLDVVTAEYTVENEESEDNNNEQE